METKYLRYFLQICEDKSVSKAAKNLYLSQQALSKIVRKLEDEFQIPIFERSKKGMLLTEYGECFKEQAAKMINILDETNQQLDALRRGHRDMLNIGMSFGVMSAFPPHYISNFQKLYPSIELQLTEYQDTFCEQAVWNEHESLGFNIAPIDSDRFNVRTVVRDKLCILVNRENALYEKEAVRFEDLKDEPVFILNNNFNLRRIFNEQCHKAGFEPHVELETMELILIHNFSRYNKGVGVSVDFITHDLADVKSIPFKPELPWEVCIITKKGKKLSPVEQCFLQYIEQFDCYYPGKS